GEGELALCQFLLAYFADRDDRRFLHVATVDHPRQGWELAELRGCVGIPHAPRQSAREAAEGVRLRPGLKLIGSIPPLQSHAVDGDNRRAFGAVERGVNVNPFGEAEWAVDHLLQPGGEIAAAGT